MRKLILQDRHVTFREIETTIGIMYTNIPTVLHKNFIVKKNCSHWIPHSWSIAQKKAHVDWFREMLKKYDNRASKYVYENVIGKESCMSRKVNSNRLYGCFQISQQNQESNKSCKRIEKCIDLNAINGD